MSRIDVHVDELFDRARAGTINAGERARLLAHCEACVGCRAELAWLRDGMHARTPSRADRELAADAVATLFGRDAEHDVAPPAGRKTARAWQSAALACAGLLLASAAAALYTGVQTWRELSAATQRGAPVEADAPRAVQQPARARRSKHVSPATSDPPPSTPAVPAAPVTQPSVVDASPAVAPAPPASAQASQPRTALLAAKPSAMRTATATVAATREQQAEALFARANELRAAGRHEQALTHYAQLTRAFPETRSALAAHVSRANLLRRADRPEAALAGYRDYLAARRVGALAEEARVGVAISLQQLGRQDDERTAWLELLDHHPGSLHRTRALARLQALSR